MPWSLKRFQEARCLHFLTFSCYRRATRLGMPGARDVFEQTLESARKWYGFYIAGYVVMPEHVHLLITEPERAKLSLALQMLKQNVARQLREAEGGSFWQARYYGFNVWSEASASRSCDTSIAIPWIEGWCRALNCGRGAAFVITHRVSRVRSRLSRSGLRGRDS
jgi:REP element-mobilizing transposase RayT